MSKGEDKVIYLIGFGCFLLGYILSSIRCIIWYNKLINKQGKRFEGVMKKVVCPHISPRIGDGEQYCCDQQKKLTGTHHMLDDNKWIYLIN